jgi:hypothetical protein
VIVAGLPLSTKLPHKQEREEGGKRVRKGKRRRREGEREKKKKERKKRKTKRGEEKEKRGFASLAFAYRRSARPCIRCI